MKSNTLSFSLVAAVLFLSVFPSTLLLAQIRVSPTILMANPSSRTIAVFVQNPSDKNEREMWVEFRYGYEKMDEHGVRSVVDLPIDSGGDRSAAKWLRAYPQRFVLPAAGAQVVRISAAPPAGLPDGEYWARVFISSKPTGTAKRKVKTQETGSTSTFRMIETADIPYHYRRGNVNSGLIVRDVTVSPAKDSVRVAVDLQRTGNSSYWGTVTCRLKNQDGKVVGILKKNLVLYLDGTYVCSLRIDVLPAGAYTLDLNFNTDGAGAIHNYVVKSEPVNYSKSITIP